MPPDQPLQPYKSPHHLAEHLTWDGELLHFYVLTEAPSRHAEPFLNPESQFDWFIQVHCGNQTPRLALRFDHNPSPCSGTSAVTVDGLGGVEMVETLFGRDEWRIVVHVLDRYDEQRVTRTGIVPSGLREEFERILVSQSDSPIPTWKRHEAWENPEEPQPQEFLFLGETSREQVQQRCRFQKDRSEILQEIEEWKRDGFVPAMKEPDLSWTPVHMRIESERNLLSGDVDEFFIMQDKEAAWELFLRNLPIFWNQGNFETAFLKAVSRMPLHEEVEWFQQRLGQMGID